MQPFTSTLKRTPSSKQIERLTPSAVQAANDTLRIAYAALSDDPTLAMLRVSTSMTTYHWLMLCETCCASGLILADALCPECQGDGLVPYVPPIAPPVSQGSARDQDAAAAFAALSQH